MKYIKPDYDSKTSGIQEAINEDESGNIFLCPGEYHIKDQLIIKSGTMIFSNNRSILINDLNDISMPFIVVEEYSDINYLIVNSNKKSGISVGKPGKNNNINIGYLKIYNTGENQAVKAIEVNGFNIIINSLDIFLGNIGLSLENSSDIRIKELQAVNCSTGIRMFNANNISIDNLSVDSCYYTGIQIDSTTNSYFKGTIWNNNNDYPGNNNIYGVSMGKYGNNNSIKMDLRILDTGKTAFYISNSFNVGISAIIGNIESKNIDTGIYYGNNLKNIKFDGIIDNVKKPYSGELNNNISMSIINS